MIWTRITVHALALDDLHDDDSEHQLWVRRLDASASLVFEYARPSWLGDVVHPLAVGAGVDGP